MLTKKVTINIENGLERKEDLVYTLTCTQYTKATYKVENKVASGTRNTIASMSMYIKVALSIIISSFLLDFIINKKGYPFTGSLK